MGMRATGVTEDHGSWQRNVLQSADYLDTGHVENMSRWSLGCSAPDHLTWDAIRARNVACCHSSQGGAHITGEMLNLKGVRSHWLRGTFGQVCSLWSSGWSATLVTVVEVVLYLLILRLRMSWFPPSILCHQKKAKLNVYSPFCMSFPVVLVHLLSCMFTVMCIYYTALSHTVRYLFFMQSCVLLDLISLLISSFWLRKVLILLQVLTRSTHLLLWSTTELVLMMLSVPLSWVSFSLFRVV